MRNPAIVKKDLGRIHYEAFGYEFPFNVRIFGIYIKHYIDGYLLIQFTIKWRRWSFVVDTGAHIGHECLYCSTIDGVCVDSCPYNNTCRIRKKIV